MRLNWMRLAELRFKIARIVSEGYFIAKPLPTDVWAIREMLPVEPHCTLPCYHDMPLVTETRCFIGDGKIQCAHPYWPRKAIAQGVEPNPVEREDWWGSRIIDPPVPDDLIKKAQDIGTGWEPIATKIAKIFNDDGEWSVDLLKTTRGWFVTDMAEASRSFHWEECEKKEVPVSRSVSP